MLTDPCAAMSMGTDVRDLTLLAPAPPVSSIPGAGGSCGMSVSGGQWQPLLDLHPSSPYGTLSSHHSLIKQEPSWGSADPVDDPHCGLGAFTLHFSGQFTGSGPCRMGAFGEPTAGQPRMFPAGPCLPSCIDSPPPPRSQGMFPTTTTTTTSIQHTSGFTHSYSFRGTGVLLDGTCPELARAVSEQDVVCSAGSFCPVSGGGLAASC